MKFLSQIKIACKKLNVPEKYAEKIHKVFNVESEDNIETFVQMFKDNILSDLENKEDVEKARQEAAQKAIKEYEEKHNLVDGKSKNNESNEGGKNEEIPAYLKEFMENQKKLQETISQMQVSMATSQKNVSADALFEKSNLPKKWRNRIDVNSETPVEKQIEDLQSEYQELRQEVITSTVGTGFLNTPKERTEKEWQDLMNEDTDNSKDSSVAPLDID